MSDTCIKFSVSHNLFFNSNVLHTYCSANGSLWIILLYDLRQISSFAWCLDCLPVCIQPVNWQNDVQTLAPTNSQFCILCILLLTRSYCILLLICAKTCTKKLIIKYIIHRIIHLLVLIEFVRHFVNSRKEQYESYKCQVVSMKHASLITQHQDWLKIFLIQC